MKTLFTSLTILLLLNTNTIFAQKSADQDRIQEDLYIIAEDNPCMVTGKQKRTQTRVILNAETPEGSRFYGVSDYGDLAVVYHDQGKTILDLYLCSREKLNGEGNISADFVLESSSDCIVDQITSGEITLGSTLSTDYRIKFSPIYIPGTKRQSSLCPESTKGLGKFK